MKNVSAKQAYQALLEDPSARLIDVRTDAEWAFVGLPDLSDAGKQVVLIPWQLFPSMKLNEQFVQQLEAEGVSREDKLFFICRSGARSAHAAHAAEAAGFPTADNVAEGFEGPVDRDGHRGRLAGWKADGLPWRQR